MNTRRLTRILLVLAVVAGVHGLLAGCGQKGPLYLPDDSQAAESEKKKDSN